MLPVLPESPFWVNIFLQLRLLVHFDIQLTETGLETQMD